jgi:hypothetical protein
MMASQVQTRFKAVALSVLIVAGGIYSVRASAQAATDIGDTKPAANVSTHKGFSGMSHHGRGEQMLRRMDTDKDGLLSKAELQAAQQKQLDVFDRADANKDGKLSAEERKAFHETMRAEYKARRG